MGRPLVGAVGIAGNHMGQALADHPLGRLLHPAAEGTQDASFVQLQDVALVKPVFQQLYVRLYRPVPLRMGHHRQIARLGQRIQHLAHITLGFSEIEFHQNIIGVSDGRQCLFRRQLGRFRQAEDLRAGPQLQLQIFPADRLFQPFIALQQRPHPPQ